MDTNYKIIWFEDIDEWFNTISRRVTKYIESKNFEVQIKRIKSAQNFSLEDKELKNYDLLIIDYELEKVSKENKESTCYGSDIIQQIRQGKFVNDILFYSSHGYDIISKVMREKNMQGVFIADRDNDEFLDMIKRLVDKSVRRAENIVNIRGIVMDATSEFDNIIKDLISLLWLHLGDEETKISTDIKNKILKDNKKTAEKLFDKYQKIDKHNIDALLSERDFSAYRQARLLSWCIEANSSLKAELYEILKENVGELKEGLTFFDKYNTDVISYRNALAHVKNTPEGNGECYIGSVNGQEVVFDEELCKNIRKTIICYDKMLNSMYSFVETKK